MRHELVAEGFRSFVARTGGETGRDWLSRLPAIHEQLARRWQLQLGPELPGGLLSSVRLTTRADGRQAVLKVSSHTGVHQEIAALRAWAGRASPRLLETAEDLQAILLERIEPGDHPEPAGADEIACLLQLLHRPAPDGVPALAELVRARVETAVADRRASSRKAAWALTAIDELERDAPPPVLVHGDFDERNLLVCAQRGLCAIDPLPCRGDPAYDAGFWVHANRRPGRRARLDAIVAATGLERARVRDWAAVVGVHG